VVLTVTDNQTDTGQVSQSVPVTEPGTTPLAANDIAVCIDTANVPTVIDWLNSSSGDGRSLIDPAYSSSKGFTSFDGTTLTYTATRLRGGDNFGYSVTDGNATASGTVSISFPKNGC
jgi:hypothetical protein